MKSPPKRKRPADYLDQSARKEAGTDIRKKAKVHSNVPFGTPTGPASLSTAVPPSLGPEASLLKRIVSGC
jgi:hypothetical protein